MIKPWSISTAVRSPDRLRNFLSVLAESDGKVWDAAEQEHFQIRLVQENFFYNDFSRDDLYYIATHWCIPYQRAAEIFASKKYKNPSRRARILIRPLIWYGFATLNGGVIRISEMGKLLLAETRDYCDVILRFLLKWELPNSLEPGFCAAYGYNIKPFAGSLRLIAAVNRLSRKKRAKEKGISYYEFGIFALTLIDWQKIEETAEEIMAFRERLARVPAARRDEFIADARSEWRPHFDLRRGHAHTDIVFCYFRATKYFEFRNIGGECYIDLSPFRKIEIGSLFKRDNARPIFYTPEEQARV